MDSSTFLSECTLIAPSLANIRNSLFQDAALFNKTGSGANTWGGGNTFNSLCEINKSGSGSISTASVKGDTFNLDVKLKSAGTGDLRIGSDYGETSVFKKNIDFTNSAKPVIFGPGSILLNGTAEQSLIGADSLTHHFDYLEVDNPAGVVLQMPIDIGALLKFTDGIVQSSDTTAVTFTASGFAFGASDTSHIDGLVRKLDLGFGMTFTFPVGDSSYYAPIAVRGASGTPDFEALYQYFDPDSAMYDATLVEAPINHISRKEHWLLNLLSSGSAYVKLSWDTRSFGVDTPADLVVARWDGSKWVSEGAGTLAGDASAGTIESAAPVTNFSPFTLASISAFNPLPIELLYFKASPVEQTIELEWATATEHNNAYFTIERSADGRTFEDITTLPGAGNSQQMIVYRSTDEQPLEGLSYYRLRQTDFDGASTFSDIVSIRRNADLGDITVSPVPSPDRRFTLRWPAHYDVRRVILIDATGRAWPLQPLIDASQTTLDLTHLPAGVYFASLQSPQQQRWVKIILN
ncbi:MAG: T9SS type A sorting domain-containing protein [Saprospiraceae bacterium]|nr:T9SS type A sorting domain-containing protein [Saprospiraceae bacterium]